MNTILKRTLSVLAPITLMLGVAVYAAPAQASSSVRAEGLDGPQACSYTYVRYLDPLGRDYATVEEYANPHYLMEVANFVEVAYSANTAVCHHRIRSITNVYCWQWIQGKRAGINCGIEAYTELWLDKVEDTGDIDLIAFGYRNIGSTGPDGKDTIYGPYENLCQTTSDHVGWVGAKYHLKTVIGGWTDRRPERHYGWWKTFDC